MKYLCLVYLDDEKWSAVPDTECAQYGKGLRDSGHWVTGQALQPRHTALRPPDDARVWVAPLGRLAPDEPQVIYDGSPSEVDNCRDRRAA